LDSKPAAGGSIFGENGEITEEGKFKLLKIDLSSNTVERVYTFNDLNKKTSGLNDIRINIDKNLGYLSDPGQSAIVILDLETGKTRSILKEVAATKADPDVVLNYQGKEMRNKNGKPFSSNVNEIALTKDNKYLYFKPINQLHLSRIETRYLSDSSLSKMQLESKIEDLGEVGITHGLVADGHGNIYLTTSTDYSIKYLSPDGKLQTLVQDSRLLWPDSLGVGTDGYLYFTCAQLQRQPEWNNGISKVELPYRAYSVRLPK
jgi:sugar lactone lactonase YvrE